MSGMTNLWEESMAVSVYIPTSFRKLTGNQASVESQARDVASLLEELGDRFPGMRNRLTAHLVPC